MDLSIVIHFITELRKNLSYHLTVYSLVTSLKLADSWSSKIISTDTAHSSFMEDCRLKSCERKDKQYLMTTQLTQIKARLSLAWMLIGLWIRWIQPSGVPSSSNSKAMFTIGQEDTGTAISHRTLLSDSGFPLTARIRTLKSTMRESTAKSSGNLHFAFCLDLSLASPQNTRR